MVGLNPFLNSSLNQGWYPCLCRYSPVDFWLCKYNFLFFSTLCYTLYVSERSYGSYIVIGCHCMLTIRYWETFLSLLIYWLSFMSCCYGIFFLVYEHKLILIYDSFGSIVVSSGKYAETPCEYRMFDSAILHLFFESCVNVFTMSDGCRMLILFHSCPLNSW